MCGYSGRRTEQPKECTSRDRNNRRVRCYRYMSSKDTQMRWIFLNIGLILKFYYSILTGPPEKC